MQGNLQCVRIFQKRYYILAVLNRYCCSIYQTIESFFLESAYTKRLNHSFLSSTALLRLGDICFSKSKALFHCLLSKSWLTKRIITPINCSHTVSCVVTSIRRVERILSLPIVVSSVEQTPINYRLNIKVVWVLHNSS